MTTKRKIRIAFTLLLLFFLSSVSLGQSSLKVTFRYIKKPGESFVRVFVPGTMPAGTNLDWGPNSSGFISPNAPSLMMYDTSVDAFIKSYDLSIGAQYEYKFHFHYNDSGTDWQWISDPLNPNTTGNYNNSVITITDPFFFEPALHLDQNGLVQGMSVGIFTNKNISDIKYVIGTDTLDGTANLNANQIFYVQLDPPQNRFARYLITAVIDSQEYVVYDQPAIEIVEAPKPAGARPGLTISNKKATFVVFAPAQPVVQLLAGKAGETLSGADAVPMKKATGETDVWWLEKDLPVGEYEYVYLLSDGRRISDPFSRRVRNGKTVFQIGAGGVSTADNFPWQTTDYVRPELDTLIIYELHVDDFSAKGNAQGKFTDIISRLDYLDSLGINAIELMPVMEFPGNRSWGYNTSHYTAVESAYGTPWNFKQLVDEAHKRGIAIILDIVWNHADGSNPLWQIQPDYDLNPYFKRDNDLRPRETQIGFGGVDLDHFTPETQAYVAEVHRIWVQEYHVDGFRFDFTRGIGWDPAQPQFGILGWSSALKALDSTVYQIAEHLPADPYLIRTSTLDAGWNDSFHDQLVLDIYGPKPTLFTLSRMVLQLHEYNTTNPGYENRTQTVKATVTHDEQSLIQEMVTFKNIPLETALQRDLLYSTMTFTSLGIPMIWQGQELGMQSGWNDDNHNGSWDDEKLSYRPMDWSLTSTDRGRRHFNYYQKLISLRKRNPALYRGAFFDLWRYNTARVLVYGYRDETQATKGDAVMAVANFSGQPQTVTQVPWLSAGSWIETAGTDSVLTVQSDTLDSFTIPAYTAKIYFKDIQTSVLPQNLPVAHSYELKQNYPNPFNPTTSMEFTLPKREYVVLKVYSVLGREIDTIVAKTLPAGHYRFHWTANNLSSGIYYYRITAGSFKMERKMILLQ